METGENKEENTKFITTTITIVQYGGRDFIRILESTALLVGAWLSYRYSLEECSETNPTINEFSSQERCETDSIGTVLY